MRSSQLSSPRGFGQRGVGEHGLAGDSEKPLARAVKSHTGQQERALPFLQYALETTLSSPDLR
jgi:hypothetical protein